MPTEVTADIDRDRAALQALAGRMPATNTRILGEMGRYLVSQERRHFLALVRNGNSNGVTWRKPAPMTIEQRRRLARQGLLAADPSQIGIRTGDLLRGFRYHVQPDEQAVSVFNVSKHTNAFDASRPIFPQSFPAAWLDGCERIAQQTLDKERLS